ncbi:unnamed protein product [Lactuca saligna]|uniref:Transposase (putative) gypsy type domain-containing protein n=1 Tax=Lactuca saligna TaxID=75948 RepID=A0AA36E3N1_LACSI|nr:unnamed protein product [Lactuca saligna]
MASSRSMRRNLKKWETFQFRFRFVPKHDVQILLSNASLYNPLEGNVGILIALFEAGLHFPTTNFFNLIMHEYGISVRELTPIAINKIVGFELLYRAIGCQLNVQAFKHFFNTSTQFGPEPFLVGGESLPLFTNKSPRRTSKKSSCG